MRFVASPALPFAPHAKALLLSAALASALGTLFATAAAGELAPTEMDASFLARAQEHIAAREYWASESARGLQAPNRRHDLRTYFEPTGVRVHDRTGGGSPRLVELRLGGIGRGAALAAVAAGEVVHHEGRVEIRREGLVEWYENSARGLEQGFTLLERPAAYAPGELVLELSVTGARASRRGDAIALATEAGRTLAYGKLAAVDARGRSLPARLEAPAPDRVRLVVADAGAAYPLIIDPLLEATADAQLESDQAYAFFGHSVSSAGDVDGDGYADVIVGAIQYDAGEDNEGAAFVFLGSDEGITDGSPTTAHAQLEADQENAFLGKSVASAGDVNGDGFADVIVGAYAYDAGDDDEGAAFVFLGSPAGIVGRNPTTAHARLESNQENAQLGWSVSSAGDVDGDGFADVIVGARLYDVSVPPPGEEDTETDEGAAFVFLGSPAGIVGRNPANAHARLESNQENAQLGASVSSAGDVDGDGFADVIIGAYLYQASPSPFVAAETDEGAAFVFLGSPAGIVGGSVTTAHARIEANQRFAWLGQSVSSAGDVDGDGYTDVIVGATYYDAGETNEGAAFVFLGSPAGIVGRNPTTAHARLESDQAGTEFGRSVSSAGDVNGDGYADVIVGARYFDAGEVDEGAAFVFLGSAEGIGDGNPSTAHAQLESDQVGAQLGFSVSSAGDVNGDAYGDVIVGARYFDAGETDEGAAFVFLGSDEGIADGNPTTADAQLESDQADAWLGASVSSAGDVNGDGYADVIVGATRYDAGQTDEGAAFVFLGSATGVADGNPGSAHAQLEADQAIAQLGSSVSTLGDVNGDGYADVIVGATLYDAGENNEGAAFVFLGSAAGIADGDPGSADAQLEADQEDAWLGRSVSSAGDVDGDGFADAIVGANGYDAGETNEGAAFVFLGSAAGIGSGNPGSAHAQLEADQAAASLGQSVSAAGDVNGDGFADVIVGAPLYDADESDEGAAFVFLGNGDGDGRPVLAQQLRGDGSATPVEPWGSSRALDGFEVRMTATDPAGRGRVKLEVEFCEPSVAFGHASCGSQVSSTWTDVTASSDGVSLTEAITGLTPETLYRWRARVLYAPFSVTQAGVTAPPNPAHGPWRRFTAQAAEADVRVDDGDGMSGAIEDAAPNGGDGNGDGILDCLQSDVASAPGAEGSGYVTATVSGGCSLIQDLTLEKESEQDESDPSFDYPYGIVGFRLPCTSASLKLYFHGGAPPGPPYRKFGPTTPGVPATEAWYDLPGAVYGSETVGAVEVTTVSFALADGALGDVTGIDGTIVDPGGPVALPEPGAWLSLAVGGALIAALRRRAQHRTRDGAKR